MISATGLTHSAPWMDERQSAAYSARLAGRSWMVWLAPAGREPSLERSGLEPGREAWKVGRCLIVLPDDGEAASWHCTDDAAALLYGHLLNRAQIARQLELDREPSPAELLLAAYRAWGSRVAERLDGAFSAVIWDEPQDRLLCIRDPIGLVPLFYSEGAPGLVVSTDIRTVLRHPGVSAEVNRAVLAEHMLCRHSEVRDTFFTEVRRLSGAHLLQAHGHTLKVERYWDPLPPPGAPIDYLSQADLTGFGPLMQQTVASYMSLGPTAISLSSGVDSVSVAAFAAQVAQQSGTANPHGLSVQFPDPAIDESVGQSGVARDLGLPFRLITFDECLKGRSLFAAALELSPSYPSPLVNLWEPVYSHLAELARERDVRVILTGNGGDEWLGVTPMLAADLLRAGDLPGLWHMYTAQRRSYQISPLALGWRLLWRFGGKPLLRDLAYRYAPGWIARRRRPVELPDWVAPDPELRSQLIERLTPPPPQPPVDSAYLRELRPALQHPMVMLELEELYSRSYGRGVSYLHPYWSRPLTEFLVRTPPILLNEGGRSKGFVRRMMAEWFPTLDLDRQKKIHCSHFFGQVIADQWADCWRPWSCDSALARSAIVDAPRLEAAMQSALNGHSGLLSLWLMSEAWLRGQA